MILGKLVLIIVSGRQFRPVAGRPVFRDGANPFRWNSFYWHCYDRLQMFHIECGLNVTNSTGQKSYWESFVSSTNFSPFTNPMTNYRVHRSPLLSPVNSHTSMPTYFSNTRIIPRLAKHNLADSPHVCFLRFPNSMDERSTWLSTHSVGLRRTFIWNVQPVQWRICSPALPT